MPLCYRSLGDTSFSEIHRTFVAAFADYHLDMSYLTEEVLLSRAVKNGIDFDMSVGAFDAGELVGCTLIGLGRWRGELAAFDIVTGVKKPYRGRGVASGMFEHALPRMRSRGATRLVLEVLRQNESAIKAYRKAGFEVVREFDCYSWDTGGAGFTSSAIDAFEVVVLRNEALAEFADSLDWAPSWENSFAAIDRIPDAVTLLGATHEGKAVGLLVYHPGLSWIMSWVVRRRYRRRGVGTLLAQRLIERLPGRVAGVKVLNVLSTDRGMAAFLCRLGFEVYASQFEMERAL